jgi:DNA polymerase III alpha subunit
MTFPQLRVRTGFSFRNAYGHLSEIMVHLKDIGCDTAAVVDKGTWAHVKFERAADKAGITPIYGAEIGKSWVLARDTRALYNLTSRDGEFDAAGVVRMAGGAFDLPADAYDYVDVNASAYAPAFKAVRKARLEGKPMILTSYNDFPARLHEPYAHAWEVRESTGIRHIATCDEMWTVLSEVMSRKDFDSAIQNTYALAAQLKGTRLAKAPIIKTDGDLIGLARQGQMDRMAKGHIKDWTAEYEARFNYEMDLIKSKEFDSYFIVVSDLVQFAKQNMLVGPGRGSSAGSLICYLLRITEVDPIPHKLSFERMLAPDRMDAPDIDIDFPDTKRDMIFDYLKWKYGDTNVSKLGNVNTLQAASVLAQVGKRFGIHINETMPIRDSLISYTSSEDQYGTGLAETFTSTETGVNFARKYPEAARCMGELETHPSHAGVHAAGVLVCNEPVTNFCTVTEDGIAQIDKPDAEYLNLLKIDVLGLRTLGVIEDAAVMTPDQLYGLPLDDANAISILRQDKMGGIFQFEGDTVRATTRAIDVTQFKHIDHITALARPGPLVSGMAQRYIDRASGKKEIEYDVPQLEPYLKDTLGVLIYQEQVMAIVRGLGNFDWKQTTTIRKAMAKSQGNEFFNQHIGGFIEGAASHGIRKEDAKEIWNNMVTFGSYGFNQAHSVSYAIVTYWTCYLKYYFPMEFAAATLRAAKDDEQTVTILRELAREGVKYVALDPELSDANWRVVDGRLIGGIRNAKGFGPVKSFEYIQKRQKGTLTDKDRERLAKAEVKFADLYEAHTKWGEYYKHPKLAGVTSGNPIVEIKDIEEKEEGLVIAKLIGKTISDENDPQRMKKRGGKSYKGQSKFLDLQLADDSTDGTMTFRIRPELYEEKGIPILDAPAGSWFLVKGWRIKGFEMFIVKNIKQLS